MPDDPRVQELLDELMDRETTPEEVCGECIELLPVVRERWRQIRRAREEFDALLPVTTHGHSPILPPEDLPLPQVPGYEVDAMLGHGGMGVVFRARHLRLGRFVALKMTLAGSYAGPRERERFRREAEAIAALRHANVVQVHDVGDWDGRPYFTMELIEGGSLAQRLAGAPQPARQAATLLATLAEAVHAAHQAGIVHRDLKPANILFASDGTPKITDFGLARRIEQTAGLTLSGAPLGTPSYMAPEQARGESKAIGPAVDIYALGAILYEMLTGRPPFRAETPSETILQVIDQEPVPPAWLNAKVPRDLQTICLKCLRKEPPSRYLSTAEFVADLRRFLDGEPILARPVGLLGRLARWIRRRPALSASVAIAMVLVVVSLWLADERFRAGRLREADRVATERAASDDLREMVDSLGRKSWTEASAALERANGRLGGGDRGSPGLRQALDQGRRDLKLVARLDEILAGIATSDRGVYDESSDEAYAEAFLSHGLGRTDEPPEIVASRIRASPIRGALVDALDVWTVPATKSGRKVWLMDVARRSDPDPSAWVVSARDPEVRRDRKALDQLARTAPVDSKIVPLIVSIAVDLANRGGDPLPLLRRVQASHPGDFWANSFLSNELIRAGQDGEALRFAQASVALRPGFMTGYTNLGAALIGTGKGNEAIQAYRTGVRIDPESLVTQFNFGHSLIRHGLSEEGIAFFREAIRLTPRSALLHFGLGYGLATISRNDEALAEYRRAIAFDPKRAEPHLEMRRLLYRLGRRDEAGAAWADHLSADPQNLNVWDGYTEYCLFLGREADYRRARRVLYARFAETAEFRAAERIGRACLLLPASPEETAQATALIDRALVDAEATGQAWVNPYFLFAKGLAEYRMDRPYVALAIMRGEASGVLRPGPQLVEAMALHRLGHRDEARTTLESAIGNYDWKEPKVDDRDAWMYHALRREAEQLIGAGEAAKSE